MTAGIFAPLPPHDIAAWRSLLFVPANVPRFVAKAMGLDVDIVILDLEDAIDSNSKATARGAVPAAAAALKAAGRTVFVRINRRLDLAVRDIEEALTGDVAGLVLPKVAGAGHVRLLSELVALRETDAGIPMGRTRYALTIESCDGLDSVDEIASADPRNFAMMLGPEDFLAELGSEDVPELLLFPQQQLLMAARRAGIVPLGLVGGMPNYTEAEAFAGIVRRSRAFGFEGAAIIHPALLPALNHGFLPDEHQIAQAEHMLAAYQESVDKGRGATGLDGKMIDLPVVNRAKSILRRAGKSAVGRP